MRAVSSPSRIKVVVVEDDLAHQEELLIRLRDEGYDVHGADCGESLDEIAKEGRRRFRDQWARWINSIL